MKPQAIQTIFMHETDLASFFLTRRIEFQSGAILIRGAHCKNKEAAMDELAAAFQLPPGFGRNWDALEEGLFDLTWIDAPGFLVIVADAPSLMIGEPAGGLLTFLSILRDVSDEGAGPLDLVSRDARRPFRIVFHGEPGAEADVARIVSLYQTASDH